MEQTSWPSNRFKGARGQLLPCTPARVRAPLQVHVRMNKRTHDIERKKMRNVEIRARRKHRTSIGSGCRPHWQGWARGGEFFLVTEDDNSKLYQGHFLHLFKYFEALSRCQCEEQVQTNRTAKWRQVFSITVLFLFLLQYNIVMWFYTFLIWYLTQLFCCWGWSGWSYIALKYCGWGRSSFC